LNTLKDKLRSILHVPSKILQFLNIGRVIKLVDGNIDWGYGVSINFHRKDNKKSKNEEQTQVVDAMVRIKPKKDHPIFKPADYK